MSEGPQRQRKPLRPVEPGKTFAERIIADMLDLPRLARIFIVTFFAVAVTLALSPMIDTIYLEYFFDEGTVILPSLVAAGFGLAMYVAGWVLVVGWQGGQQRPRRAILGYVVVGVIAVVVVFLWFLLALF